MDSKIYSMTGFGRGTKVSSKFQVQVELKTVNGKHFDLRAKLPRVLSVWEYALKKRLRTSIERGTIEVYVYHKILDPSLITPINESSVATYSESIGTIAKKLGIPSGLSVSSLLRLPNTFITEEAPRAEDETKEIFELLDKALEEAIVELLQMRCKEGEAIVKVLQKELHEITRYMKEIKTLASGVRKRMEDRLHLRIQKLPQFINAKLDESRLLQEVAYYVDRSDISEELDRIDSHLSQFQGLLVKNEKSALGKRLDFLVQEIMREANTLGAKAGEIEITNRSIEVRLGLDKIREQIQNLE